MRPIQPNMRVALSLKALGSADQLLNCAHVMKDSDFSGILPSVFRRRFTR